MIFRLHLTFINFHLMSPSSGQHTAHRIAPGLPAMPPMQPMRFEMRWPGTAPIRNSMTSTAGQTYLEGLPWLTVAMSQATLMTGQAIGRESRRRCLASWRVGRFLCYSAATIRYPFRFSRPTKDTTSSLCYRSMPIWIGVTKFTA